MPVLGYGQVSSIAPNLISKGYEGIVRNLQQTGQEIAANVQRVQTNKQVQALGQEMATIDPYSPTFPQQMLAVATKYPMALADQRGQALMGVLGIAHKDYLAQKMDATNFAQAKELAGLQHGFRMDEIGARPSSASGRFKTVPGVGLVDTMAEGGPQIVVEGTYNLNEGGKRVNTSGEVIAEGGPRTTATPYSVSGGFVADRTTGQVAPLPLNTLQGEQLRLRQQQEAAKEQRLQLKDNVDRALREKSMIMSKKPDEVSQAELDRIPFLNAEIDRSATRMKELEVLEMPVSPALMGAPGLGGLNPIQAAPTPLPVPVPMVPDAAVPSVLPTPAQLPAPQTPKNSGANWKKFLTPP